MRLLLLIIPLVAVGCSAASSPPVPAFSQKEMDATIEKRVKEELAKRDTDQRMATEDAAKKLAVANKLPEPKVWTFDEAIQDVNRKFTDLKPDNFDVLAKRLTEVEAATVSQILALTPEQWVSLPANFKDSYSSTLRSAGFANAILIRNGRGGMSRPAFRELAKAVWDKVPSFRTPKAIAQAALVAGRNNDGAFDFAGNYFPKNVASGPTPEHIRDFWEEFSGTTWDKLR